MWLFSSSGSATATLLLPPLPNQDSFKAAAERDAAVRSVRCRCGASEPVARSVAFNPFPPSFGSRTALPLVLAGAHWLAVGPSLQSATGPNRTALSLAQVMASLTSCKWSGFSGPGLAHVSIYLTVHCEWQIITRQRSSSRQSEGAAAEWLRRSTDKERGMHAQETGHGHSHGGNECSEWSDVDGSSFDDNTCASADSPPTTVAVVLSLSSHLNSRQSDTERTERTSTYAAATLNF